MRESFRARSTIVVLLAVIVALTTLLVESYRTTAWHTVASSPDDDECRRRLSRLASALEDLPAEQANVVLAAKRLQESGVPTSCPYGCEYGLIELPFESRGRVWAVCCGCGHGESNPGWNLEHDPVILVGIPGGKVVEMSAPRTDLVRPGRIRD